MDSRFDEGRERITREGDSKNKCFCKTVHKSLHFLQLEVCGISVCSDLYELAINHLN